MKAQIDLTKKSNDGLGWLFWLVFAFKAGASFFFASPYLAQLFIPFLSWFVTNHFHNPWDFFYGLNAKMFPYPGLMLWIMSVPRLLLGPVLSGDWKVVTPLHLFAARIPLLAADILLFLQLNKFFPNQRKKIIGIYWCSPIVFFINYIHGQLDIIPTALFFAAIYFLVESRYLVFVLFLALAAATKNHVLIAVPFIWIFLYKKRLSFFQMAGYFLLFVAAYFSFLLPYLNSPAFRQMVFHSPEQGRLFDFVIPVSSTLKLIICPTVIALLFIKFASYKKLNREILLMFLGIVFASLVVFVPPMPGWFMWSFPFLVYFYMHNKDYSRAPFVIYNAVYVLYFLFFFEKEGDWINNLQATFPVKDFALSIVMSSVGFIAFWMFNLGLRKNEELKAVEAPLLIGIGGDSGTGKHTLLRVLRSLVGKSRSMPILGDDFHKWERGNQNWNVYTHLNPSANHLHKGANLAVALKEGYAIEMVHYDHHAGKFTHPEVVQPNKFVFFVGLHPFYLKKMRDLIPIKIYMDTDEDLRRTWKVRRDMTKRGHSQEKVIAQISARSEDRKKFIEPQKDFADLLIRYSPVGEISASRSAPLKVSFTLDNSLDLDDLMLLLSRTSLEVEHFSTIHKQELIVSGAISAREVMTIAQQLDLNFDELLINPRGWVKNHNGITQLIFLLLYNHKMKAR